MKKIAAEKKEQKKESPTEQKEQKEEDKPKRVDVRRNSSLLDSLAYFFAQADFKDKELDELYEFILDYCKDASLPDGTHGKSIIFVVRNPAKKRIKYRHVFDVLAKYGFDVRTEEYEGKPRQT